MVNPVVTPKSKHGKKILFAIQFLKNDVHLKYFPTDDMTADLFTKSLAASHYSESSFDYGIVLVVEALKCIPSCFIYG